MERYRITFLVFLLLIVFFPCSLSSQSSEKQEDTWLVMLYQNADDLLLENAILFDFNEAECVGSSDQVTIVSQIDRYKGSYEKEGDWSGARRYIISSDDDLNAIGSEPVMDLGEVNMASGQTLEDFCIWAIEMFPAKRYALILSDHGMGWPGGWTDPDPVQETEDLLWMYEIGDAMERVLEKTGLESLDLLGMDACLMGQLEVFSSVEPFFDYAVASEELEPGIGWAYQGFLQDLVENPVMDGPELAQSIVDSFIIEDLSIPLHLERSQGNHNFDAANYIAGIQSETTISAVDLSAIQTFRKSFNELLVLLQGEDPLLIAKARSYSQKYTNIFNTNSGTPYIDLGHFFFFFSESFQGSDLHLKFTEVLQDLENTVIAEKHGELRPGSSGISIHFPNSELYSSSWGGGASYSSSVPEFCEKYYWDEFLLQYYTGKEFKSDEAVDSIVSPTESDEITSPGTGSISVENLRAEKERISLDDDVTITAEIHGNNIAYIYLEVLYYDPESDFFLQVDSDYLEADDVLELNGIVYPDWTSSAGIIELEFDWEPILFILDDGVDSCFSLLEPYDYGLSAEDTIYTIDGLYYSLHDDREFYSICSFTGDGQLKDIYGFEGEYGLGAPHQVVPNDGDQFAPYEWWVTWDEFDEPVWEYEYGEYLFVLNNGEYIEWFSDTAFIGDYYIGFAVEDFDGNISSDYVYVEVIE